MARVHRGVVMFKSIGAYWVQMMARRRLGKGEANFMTIAVMAHSIEDAIATARTMAEVQSYLGSDTWNHVRNGVIDLEILKDLFVCDDHAGQVLSVAVHGVLQTHSLEATPYRNAPNLDRLFLAGNGALSGWCAVGSHRIRPYWREELEAALLGAIIQ